MSASVEAVAPEYTARHWHGVSGDSSWQPPVLAVESAAPVRADQVCCGGVGGVGGVQAYLGQSQKNMTRGDEFADTPAVFDAKCRAVAELLRRARELGNATVYSGAGISRASGVPDYASKRTVGSLGAAAPGIVLKTPLDAAPTKAHRVLAAMFAQGYLSEWVNQNHDGLPQKAGVPEQVINEIHGAWFDPSNPVVQFNESLRSDLFERLLETEQNTSLCLCLGTSLSGMNADRVAVACAKRFTKQGLGLGTVIVNLQRTSLDVHAAVRIWATLDATMECIARHLGVEWDVPKAPAAPTPTMTLIPYDADGHRLRDGSMRVLSLVPGTPVACGWKDRRFEGVIESISEDGHVYCVLRRPGKLARHAVLGAWWVRDAMRGRCAGDRMPLRTQGLALNPNDALAMLHFQCEMTEAKKWRWSLRVDQMLLPIETVTYSLHETFEPRVVTVQGSGVLLERLGWGYFDIPVDVVFVDGSRLSFVYPMTFDVNTHEVPLALKLRRVE